MIKLCVLDLDGTLLRDGRLHERDRKGLLEIQKSGVTLMLATGRNAQDVAEFVEKLELNEHRGIVAYSDGQYICDFKDNKCYEFEHLTYAKDVKYICGLYTGKKTVSLYCKRADYMVYRSAFSKAFGKHFLKKLFSRSKGKALFFYKDYTIEDIDEVAICATETELNVSKLKINYDVIYTNDKQRYELKHRNVNKARAVKEVAAKYRFTDDEIVVFGNDENDVCLFEEYTHSFCMENANAFTKSKANKFISQEEIVDTIFHFIKGTE